MCGVREKIFRKELVTTLLGTRNPDEADRMANSSARTCRWKNSIRRIRSRECLKLIAVGTESAGNRGPVA